jgi:TM2 domain-containing membrane protein YozV
VGDVPIRAEGERLTWVCPTCQNENPLEASACATCGTPFASLFNEPERGPRTPPGRAVSLSLLFPGVGHFALGRGVEGLARGVVFAWLIATVLAIVIMRRGVGLGPFLPLLALLLLAAVTVYVLTAVDARRAAGGEPPVLSTRVLMYGVTGLMLLTILILFVTSLRARGG